MPTTPSSGASDEPGTGNPDTVTVMQKVESPEMLAYPDKQVADIEMSCGRPICYCTECFPEGYEKRLEYEAQIARDIEAQDEEEQR
jgi:hypothetical protein